MKISKTAYTSKGSATVDGYDVRAGSMLRHVKDGSMKKVGAVDLDTGKALVRNRGRVGPDGPSYTPIEDLSVYQTVNATVWESE